MAEGLARKQVITVLPAVSSLKALRETPASHTSASTIHCLTLNPEKFKEDRPAAKLAREK